MTEVVSIRNALNDTALQQETLRILKHCLAVRDNYLAVGSAYKAEADRQIRMCTSGITPTEDDKVKLLRLSMEKQAALLQVRRADKLDEDIVKAYSTRFNTTVLNM